VADYSVQSAKHATTDGAGADAVTFAHRHYIFGITNLGGDDLYLAFDGVPAVAADESFLVLEGKYREFEFLGRAVKTVSLISGDPAEYVVEALV
jgi:hypothetical protein